MKVFYTSPSKDKDAVAKVGQGCVQITTIKEDTEFLKWSWGEWLRSSCKKTEHLLNSHRLEQYILIIDPWARAYLQV